MTWPHFIMWCAALFGLCICLRNPTGGALAANWLFAEIAWMATGESIALRVMFCADIAVITVICCKAVHREGCRTYPTLATQLQCFWRALTLWDRLVIGGYVFAAWPVYISTLHPYYAYWVLFYTALAQYAFAGSEVIQNMLGSRRERRMARPPGRNGLAYVRGGGDA